MVVGSLLIWKTVLVLGLLWCGAMEGSRIPIDLPERESELVSAYVTENAGLSYGLLASTEYCVVVIGSLGVGGFNGVVGFADCMIGMCISADIVPVCCCVVCLGYSVSVYGASVIGISVIVIVY